MFWFISAVLAQHWEKAHLKGSGDAATFPNGYKSQRRAHTRSQWQQLSFIPRAPSPVCMQERERECVWERACIKDERSTFMTRPGVSLFNTFQTEFGRTTHTGRSSLATACAARCPSGLSTRRLAGATERIFWWSFAAATAWSAFIYTISNAAGDLRAALLLIEVSPCLTPRI
jgi:hypothetical protein